MRWLKDLLLNPTKPQAVEQRSVRWKKNKAQIHFSSILHLLNELKSKRRLYIKKN